MMLNRQPKATDVEGGTLGSAPEELTVADIISFLRWYWPLIAATVLMSLTAAVLYVLSARPSYTATSQILMETNLTENVSRAITESMIAMDTPQIESQIALLRSEQITEKVAQKLAEYRKGLAPKPAEPTPPNWFSRLVFGSDTNVTPKPSGEDQALQRRAANSEIQGGMDVKRIGLSHALEVSFRSADPKVAALVANAIGDAYVQDKLDTRASAARAGGRWLEARIDELRHLMNEAALDVQQFKARRDYRILDRTDRAGDDGVVPLPGTNDARPAPAEDRSKFDQTTLEELESRAQTYRKIYESYLQAYTETVQRQSFPGTSARVISRATVPTGKSSPRSLFVLGVAGTLGMMLGLGLSLAHLSIDTTVRSPRQVNRKLGVPYLGEVKVSHLHGAIPFIRTIENYFPLRSGAVSSLVVAKAKPLSRAAHELKDAALAIKARTVARNVSVVGFLGTSNDLNAAAVASNLAIIYARSGLSTLVVDVHTSEPQMLKALAGVSANANNSLSELTSRSADAHGAIMQTDDASPVVLAVRAPSDKGALDGDLQSKLIEQLDRYRANFDLVIVHLPPLSLSARPPDVLKAIDAVVIVSKLRQTTIANLTDVASGLQIAGKPILGVINASMV